MKHFFRLISILLAFSFLFQSAFAEEQLLTTQKSYETEKGFSIKPDALVRSHSAGKIADLNIQGDGLTILENSNFPVPVFIVSNGKSVQFSFVNIKDFINIRSDFAWKLEDDGASRIDQYDWKKKMGVGAILVQISPDNEKWETVYSNTNVLADYQSVIKNFYSAKRSDLNAGCYYKVILAYKMARKTEQKNVLIFDTSSWKRTWNVEEFSFFIIADESSVTATNTDYSKITLDDDSREGDVGAVFGNATTANRLPGEESFFNNPNGGHGNAAEAANIQAAAQKGILNGDTIKHTGDDIDPNTGRRFRNGADYTITSKDGIVTEIQSKYYNTPSATLSSCFDDATGLFKFYSKTGVPMAIEVPADQYDRVVLLMQDKISKKLVPGVTDPADAEKIIRKGTITFKQAVNIAKAGNIDSLKYDAKNSCVSAASAFGVSSVVTFATSVWSGDSIDIALQKSLYAGIKVGGNAFVTSILASQLSKAGLNSLLVPGSNAIIHAIGPKASAVIINATRIGAKPIYGAAAMKSAAKLLRSNTITATISLVVFTVPDIVDIFRGRISGKQLVKNLAETAGGIGGGIAGAAAGAAGGAALGSVIPIVGTTVGGTIGAIVGALGGGVGASAGVGAIADLIAEDDADEMLDIITIEFQNLAEEYLLNNEEANQVSEILQQQLDANTLKNMFSAKNHHSYARNMVERHVKTVIEKREPIAIPTDEELADTMIDVLEDIYDESELSTDEEGGNQ